MSRFYLRTTLERKCPVTSEQHSTARGEALCAIVE